MTDGGLSEPLNENPVSPSTKRCDLPSLAGRAIRKSASFMPSPFFIVGRAWLIRWRFFWGIVFAELRTLYTNRVVGATLAAYQWKY
jgi:hypothetical protein